MENQRTQKHTETSIIEDLYCTTNLKADKEIFLLLAKYNISVHKSVTSSVYLSNTKDNNIKDT